MEGLSCLDQVGALLDPQPALLSDPWQPVNTLGEDNTTNNFLRHEKESLTRQVLELQRKLEEKERDYLAARESAETLRGEVGEKDKIIAELRQTIASLEETVRQQTQQQQNERQKQVQKKHSFPKLSMSKLGRSRSLSEVQPPPRLSPTSSRRRPVLKSDSHTHSGVPLSPLLELSAPLEEESPQTCLLDEEGKREHGELMESDVFVNSMSDDVFQSSSPGVTNGGRSPGASSSRNMDTSTTSSDSTASSSACSGGVGSLSDVATPTSVEGVDVSDLRWREGKKAPEKMCRGSVAVSGNTAYFRPSASHKVHSCTLTSGKTQWSTLPDGKFQNFGLVVLGNTLVSVGGQTLSGDYGTTSELLSLSLPPKKKQWVKIIPPMPSSRCNPAAISTASGEGAQAAGGAGGVLVVAGGYDRGKQLSCVEVLDVGSNFWYSVPSLPERVSNLVATVTSCNGELYLAGGFTGRASKSVFACPLASLMGTCDNGGVEGDGKGEDGFWRHVEDLPVTNSTIAEFCGRLLAVGGTIDFTDSPTNRVFQLSPETGKWEEVCVMRHKREKCFLAPLEFSSLSSVGKKLIVVGGVSARGSKTDHVEIADIPSFSL